MRVWSLTTVDDGCIDTDLYLTEQQCYEALARYVFGEHARAANAEVLETLTTMAMGTLTITEEIEEMFRLAIEDHDIDYAVTAHEHPWAFEADNPHPFNPGSSVPDMCAHNGCGLPASRHSSGASRIEVQR